MIHIIQSPPPVCTRAGTIILALNRWTWYHRLQLYEVLSPRLHRGFPVTSQPWTDPAAIEWSKLVLNSFRRWTGRELLERAGDPLGQAHALFLSPFVVVSHGADEDPLLNYGNQMALDLWELPWDQFVQTPSRLTAEPINRAEREWMLEQAKVRGYLDNYRGVRITSTGDRFLVDNARIWNVVDAQGQRVGQAASFAQWTWLN